MEQDLSPEWADTLVQPNPRPPTSNIPVCLIMPPSLSPPSIWWVHRVNYFFRLWFQKFQIIECRLQDRGGDNSSVLNSVPFSFMQNTGSIESINTSYAFSFHPLSAGNRRCVGGWEAGEVKVQWGRWNGWHGGGGVGRIQVSEWTDNIHAIILF